MTNTTSSPENQTPAKQQVEAAVAQQKRVDARKAEVEAAGKALEAGEQKALTPEEWFKKNMGADEDGEMAASEPEETPESVSTEASDEEHEDDESSGDVEGDEVEERPAKRNDGERLSHEDALSVLRRAGVPTSVLEGLSDEALLAWATKQSKREGDIQSAFRERAELKKQLEQGSQTTSKPEQTPTGLDLGDAAKGLFETFDENVAQALVDFNQKSVAPLLARLEASDKALKTANAAIERMMEKEIRASLLERFPQLEKKGNWDKVKEKASALAQTEAYGEADDPLQAVFSDAARLIFTKDDSSAQSLKAEKSLRQRQNGSPTPPKRSSSQATPAKSKEDIMWEQFKAIERGEGRDGSLKVLERYRR